MPQNQWNDADPFSSGWTDANPFGNQNFGSVQLQPSQLDFFGLPPIPQQIGGEAIPFWELPKQISTPQLPKVQPQEQGWFDYLTEPITRPLSTIPSKIAGGMNELMRRGDDYSYGSPALVPDKNILTGETIFREARPGELSAEKLLQFGGDMASGMTSPLNLALGGSGLIRNAALKGVSAAASPARNAALLGTANISNQVLKGASATTAGLGAYDLFNPESDLTERAFGAANLLGGGLGYKAARFFDPQPLPNRTNLPGAAADDFFAGTPKNVTPNGPSGTSGLPTKVTIKQPSQELYESLIKSGYKPGPTNEAGYPTMVLSTPNSTVIKTSSGTTTLSGAANNPDLINQFYGPVVNEPSGETLIQPSAQQTDPFFGDKPSTPLFERKSTAFNIIKGMVDRLVAEGNYTALSDLVDDWTRKANDPKLSKEFNPGYFNKLVEYGRSKLPVTESPELTEGPEFSRILPMNITPESVRQEYARHDYPNSNVENQVKFLIDNGRYRQAYALIQDMGIPRSVTELNQPVEGGRTIPIRDANDLVNIDFSNLTPERYDTIVNERLQFIRNTKNLDEALDNLNIIEQELDYLKGRGGLEDQIEFVGTLKDEALDHYRQLQTASFYDNQITTKGGKESLEMMKGIEEEVKFKPGDLVKQKSTGKIGRITGDVTKMTVQELDNYRSKIRRNYDSERDQHILDEIDNEFKRRREEGYGTKLDFNPNDEPQFARIGDKIGIGADVKSLGKVLGTSLYKGDIATIATKELLQNSLDAIRNLGSSGEIKVDFTRGQDIVPSSIRVKDNGPGLTREELETLFTDLGSSGKRSDESAIGGFGLAKAAPLLGGESVIVRSVAVNPRTGQKELHVFKGTPDELLEGVDIQSSPTNKPTGMDVEVFLPKDSDSWQAEQFIKDLSNYSEYQGKIKTRTNYHNTRSDWLSKLDEEEYDKYFAYDDAQKGDPSAARYVTTVSSPSADANIIIPSNAIIGSNSSITVILRNKGMYQNSYSKWLGGEVDDIPDKVVVDIDAKVPEGHTDYPFVANRESLRGTIESKVNTYIDENIIKPALEKAKKGLQELYDNMPYVTYGNREIYYYDTGSKADPVELAGIMNTRTMNDIGNQIAEIIDDVLLRTNKPSWINRLERTGIIFDEKLRGIHLPNPGTKKSAILINPLQLMLNQGPDEAAAGFVHTILHEIAHIEPTDRGHNESFAVRLADIYQTFGARSTVNAQDEFISAVVDPTTGSYSTEIQSLLREYQEIRGRQVTKPDILTGTGTFSRDKGSEGSRGISGSRGSVGTRATRLTPDEVNRQWNAIIAGQSGSNNQPPNKPPTGGDKFFEGDEPPKLLDESGKPSKRRELWELSRGLMSSDLPYVSSAMLRQGAPLFGTRTWFKMWKDAAQAYHSEDLYKGIMDQIKSDPLFRNRLDKNGNEIPGTSFANEIGLLITDLSNYHKREEMIKSTWAERIPLYGRHIRKSNRAYTAALNAARWRQLHILVDAFKEAGRDPMTDLVLGNQLAEVINAQTGASQAKFRLPGGKQIDLTPYNRALADALWSPKFLSSKIQQLNPFNYTQMEDPARKELLKSLFRRFAGWAVLTGGFAVLGAEVGDKITSSDFMKSRFGNIRLDSGAGLPQLIVLLARIAFGGSTSSIPPINRQKFEKSDKEFFGNAGNRLVNFGQNQLHPSAKYAWDIFNPNKYEPVHLIDRTMENLLPLYAADAAEVWKEDPSLEGSVKAALMAILGSTGLASQTYDKGSFGKPKYISPGLDFEIK